MFDWRLFFAPIDFNFFAFFENFYISLSVLMYAFRSWQPLVSIPPIHCHHLDLYTVSAFFFLSCVVTSIRKPNQMEIYPLVHSANGTKTRRWAEVLWESRNWVNYQEIMKYRWSDDLYPRSTLLLVGGCTCHCLSSGSPIRVALHGTG